MPFIQTSDVLLISAGCLVGLLIILGVPALLDAPHRAKWRRLGSEVGLKAETLGRIRLSGDFQGRYVTVEFWATPDARIPEDDDLVTLWVRIGMAVRNVHQSAFMLGRSEVLKVVVGRLAKQFENTTSVTVGHPESSKPFFVKETSAGLLQSLLARNREIEPALVAVNTPYFLQLDGPQLSYTELGSELMDKEQIEMSAGRLKLTLGLLNDIAALVETHVPLS